MLYRVILLSNGEYKKTLYRSKTKETVYNNFNKLKNENNVLFPKRF